MSASPTDPAPSPAPAPPRAAVLLVGNELLSGKVRDENGYFLAQRLRRRGIRLIETRVVEDDLDAIGSALLELAARAPVVFTSGGVGPTHDDVTLQAIARATGRPLSRNVEMEAQLRAHFGATVTEATLTMADLPRGTRLCAGPGWPVLCLDLDRPAPARVYILPGIPSLLRKKVETLEALPDELPLGTPWHLEVVHTSLDESDLAPHLDALLVAHPGLEIGSYPRWEPDEDGRLRVQVRVTLEASDPAVDVRGARDALLAQIPESARVPPADDPS